MRIVNQKKLAIFQHFTKVGCCLLSDSPVATSADPEGETGGPDPPWKITSYMGFYREYAIGTPLEKVGPPPLDNVGPPLKP